MSDVVNAELRHTIVEATNILFNLGQESGPGSRLTVRERECINDVRVRLEALSLALPGLQAEAPEDARKDALEIAKHILALIFPKANDADFKDFVERHGVHIAAIIRADRNAARTSQAEAQAPTTAAPVLTDIGASVKVGSDGRWLNLQGIGKHAMLNLESLEINSVHGPIVRMAINGFLMNLGERLTVGAPTPASTQTAKDALIDALDKTGIPAAVERAREKAAPAPTMPTQYAEVLKECADELACMVSAEYAHTKDHPAMKRRYKRDMEPVLKARATLALIAKGDTP